MIRRSKTPSHKMESYEIKPKTALFAGSFRPFTIGHKSIVDRTLKIADKVIVAIGVNPAKPAADTLEPLEKIKRIYASEPRVKVMTYKGLTVDLARREHVDFMVRGVRGTADYESERTLAEINLRISGIETLLMPALPELSVVSSSMVRELAENGYDVSEFIPD